MIKPKQPQQHRHHQRAKGETVFERLFHTLFRFTTLSRADTFPFRTTSGKGDYRDIPRIQLKAQQSFVATVGSFRIFALLERLGTPRNALEHFAIFFDRRTDDAPSASRRNSQRNALALTQARHYPSERAHGHLTESMRNIPHMCLMTF